MLDKMELNKNEILLGMHVVLFIDIYTTYYIGTIQYITIL